MKNNETIDLFDEEISKKEKKLAKKIERARKKEEKKKKAKEKEIEQQEEKGFEEYLEHIKNEKRIEENDNTLEQIKTLNFDDDLAPKPRKENLFQINENKNNESKVDIDDILEIDEETKKEHPILNVLLVICSIILIVISGDYIVFNSLTNYVDLPTMINSIIFAVMILFYLLSILIKNETASKIFELLSMIIMIIFMGYHLFII